MILEPKAKPVRIRIKIGNDEYSSVEELRDNFSVKDLFPLYLDGRLSRWLRQRGENALADRMDECSKTHRNESIDDYVYFISLFFEDIHNTLQQRNNTSDILSAFEDETHVRQLSAIFNYTTGIDGLWVNRLSVANFRIYFENEMLHCISQNKGGWGLKLAGLTSTADDYKEIVSYLEQSARSCSEYSEILSDYCKEAKEKGYDWTEIFKGCSFDEIKCWHSCDVFRPFVSGWADIFLNTVKSKQDFISVFEYLQTYSKNNRRCSEVLIHFIESAEKNNYIWYDVLELTLDDLLDYYPKFPELPHWTRYLADKTSDYESDRMKVEPILREPERIDSYYVECRKKGLVDADVNRNQWYDVANSKELPPLISILDKFKRTHLLNLTDSNFSKIHSSLGLQVRQFLIEVNCLMNGKQPFYGGVLISDPFLINELDTLKKKGQILSQTVFGVAVTVVGCLLGNIPFIRAVDDSIQHIIDKLNENRK